jgi:glycosyltransferase involved in cell wall biosynthesis
MTSVDMHPGVRILVLLTDAYGSQGGIAGYNVDLLQALAHYPGCREVVVLPRIASAPTVLPPGITYRRDAAGSIDHYVRTLLRTLMTDRDFDLVVCGHLNLTPFATLAKTVTRAPLLLVAHGIEAWQRPRRALVPIALRSVDAVAGVSRLTLDRLASWAPMAGKQQYVLPNAIPLERYSPGPTPRYLEERYAIPPDSPVLLTVGRMSSAERYKGHDEIIELLPALAARVPEVRYLVVGDGDDRSRLADKAASLGVDTHVIFTGFIPEEEKPDHFRLANVYVMPSHGEGFGRVLVEAMASGVPVVASTLDAGGEVVQATGLGVALDPRDSTALLDAIGAALATQPVPANGRLSAYSFTRFEETCHAIVADVLSPRGPWYERCRSFKHWR